MLRKHKVTGILLPGIVLMLMLTGCYKDKTVPVDTTPTITRTVTFSGDIIPIFNKSCAVSGCHSAGGKSPDLTAANAYNNLKIGNYVNTGNPTASVIYLWLTGKKATQMPVGGMNKDYNALVIAWIKQGAKNN